MIPDIDPLTASVPLASGINWEFILLLVVVAFGAIAVAWMFSSSGGGGTD